MNALDLSVVIPAYNEAENLPATLYDLAKALNALRIRYELLVVNDHSADNTEEVLREIKQSIPQVRTVNNTLPSGFGYAVRAGLEAARGEAIATYMADSSDVPADLVRFYQTLHEKKVDCVFGSRFMKGGRVVDYPPHKFYLNRLVNLFIRVIFGFRYNDTTNAFKLYRRSTIENLRPFLACHFNFTVELPLKAIVRGHSYAVVPNAWINRKHGVSKMKIQEMGSRYLFIVFYCLLERWLSRGDYLKRSSEISGQSRRNGDRSPKAAA